MNGTEADPASVNVATGDLEENGNSIQCST